MQGEDNRRLFHTAMLLALTVALSKAVGLIRDMMIAHAYGTGSDAVAYDVAAQVPTLLFDILIGAVITSAFIPVYCRLLSNEGPEKADAYATGYISFVMLVTALVAVAAFVLAGPVVRLLAPDLSGESQATAVRLTRQMMPVIVLAGLTFCFVGILQSRESYLVPACIGLVSSLLVIGYLLFLNDRFGITGLAAAMTAGWLCQALVQIPALCKAGFRIRFSASPSSRSVLHTVRIGLPMLIASWTTPLNSLIATRFASSVASGRAITAFAHANKLYVLLIGILSFAASNLLFPRLARENAGGHSDDARSLLSGSLRTLLFFCAPVACGTWLVGEPLLTVLFRHGLFNDSDVELTAAALSVLSFGMVFAAWNELLIKSMFAGEIILPPMLAAIAAVAVNAILAVLLTPSMGMRGIALAAVASVLVSTVVNYVSVRRSGLLRPDKRDYLDWTRSLLISVAAAVPFRLLCLGPLASVSPLLRLLLTGFPYVLAYLFLSFLFRSEEIMAFLKWHDRKKDLS